VSSSVDRQRNLHLQHAIPLISSNSSYLTARLSVSVSRTQFPLNLIAKLKVLLQPVPGCGFTSFSQEINGGGEETSQLNILRLYSLTAFLLITPSSSHLHIKFPCIIASEFVYFKFAG